MKSVKGIVVVAVLCLAAYGACVLFKQPAQLNVSDSERAYLEELGIYIQDSNASDSGLSAVLGDVEGIAPIGATMGTSSGSAPPGFLSIPVPSSIPPPFVAEPAPKVTAPGIEPQSVPEFSPPSTAEPAGFPVLLSPLSGSGVFPSETTPLVIPPSEAPFFETPPISATESPPPLEDDWDGPASHIPTTPPSTETLQTLNSPPPTNIPFDANEKIAHSPIVEKNLRRIIMDSANEDSFSSVGNVPLDTAPNPVPQYVQTTARQPFVFEPAKPEPSPNAPVLSFTPAKRSNRDTQPELPKLAESLQQPFIASQTEYRSEVSRPVKNPTTLPAAQPAIRESVERFIQSQRSLMASGETEDIRRAFVQLSQFYEYHPLDDSERAFVRPILDMLALKVVYAKDMHILESPYPVKPGETVESIAKNFHITPVLLRKINGLSSFQELQSGTTLKVVHGQFDAKISVKRKELTLLLGGLYAGQFAFSMPNPGTHIRSGEFFVTNRANQTLILNNGLMLSNAQARNATFAFSDQDAKEIFDILSEQSVIVVE